MSNTHSTKVSFFRAFYFCLLAVLIPKKFIKEEDAYKQRLPKTSPADGDRNIIQRSFWYSFLLIFSFGFIGYVIGYSWDLIFGFVDLLMVKILQVLGAMFLLWGTLFVRGWDIQTWRNDTLVEKVNRWLYRALCCLGTTVIVFSLAITPCVK